MSLSPMWDIHCVMRSSALSAAMKIPPLFALTVGHKDCVMCSLLFSSIEEE